MKQGVGQEPCPKGLPAPPRGYYRQSGQICETCAKVLQLRRVSDAFDTESAFDTTRRLYTRESQLAPTVVGWPMSQAVGKMMILRDYSTQVHLHSHVHSHSHNHSSRLANNDNPPLCPRTNGSRPVHPEFLAFFFTHCSMPMQAS